MPLVYQATLDADSLWGIWQIEESLDQLAEGLAGADSILAQNALAQKQRESLAARQLCRHLLESEGLVYEGLYKDEFGKPFLKNSSLQISLSHCHEVAAVVIHRHKVVGIDIEQPRTQLRRVAPKFLSETEMRFTEQDIVSLSLVWSAKEALYKLYGRKQLFFKEELNIMPFRREGSKGSFEAILNPRKEASQQFRIYYQAWQNYWLAIAGI